MRCSMIDNENNENVELKLILPAALIPEYVSVSKVTGDSVFELREKLPFYSKVDGVSLSIENETKEPIKFLISRTIDVISYNTPLRIDYASWQEGIYDILDILEAAQKEFEDVKESGVSIMIDRLSNYTISLILPLYYVDDGALVSKEKGSQLFTVHKGESEKRYHCKPVKIKAQINLDDTGLKTFELPNNSVFLVRDDKVLFKTTDDFVKIERPLAEIEDLIMLVNSFIDENESQ